VRKIALEEHFVTPELAKYGASGVAVTSDYGHDPGRRGKPACRDRRNQTGAA
jgi:hypothetical protein